jgi:DNA-binding NarL/FixJ family response regulator
MAKATCTFRALSWPRRDTTARGTAITQTRTPTPIRVVVIDDAEEIRDVLRLALDSQDDFTLVAEAADGQAGVAAVDTHQPHLVLLDVSMPVMDGFQALEQIRRVSPGSVVIVLTGYSEKAAALTAVELGAHGFIRKGGGVPELIAQIREVLEHRFGLTGRATQPAADDVPRPPQEIAD